MLHNVTRIPVDFPEAASFKINIFTKNLYLSCNQMNWGKTCHTFGGIIGTGIVRMFLAGSCRENGGDIPALLGEKNRVGFSFMAYLDISVMEYCWPYFMPSIAPFLVGTPLAKKPFIFITERKPLHWFGSLCFHYWVQGGRKQSGPHEWP